MLTHHQVRNGITIGPTPKEVKHKATQLLSNFLRSLPSPILTSGYGPSLVVVVIRCRCRCCFFRRFSRGLVGFLVLLVSAVFVSGSVSCLCRHHRLGYLLILIFLLSPTLFPPFTPLLGLLFVSVLVVSVIVFVRNLLVSLYWIRCFWTFVA